MLSKAKGPYVWDVEGKRYLDFSAGIAVNALGGGDGGVLKVGFRFSSLFRRLSDELLEKLAFMIIQRIRHTTLILEIDSPSILLRPY